jgi:hypothetical protein
MGKGENMRHPYKKEFMRAFLIASLFITGIAGSVAARDRNDRHHDRGRYHSGSGFNFGISIFHENHHPRFWNHSFSRAHYWGGFCIGSRWFYGPTLVVSGIPYYFYNGYYYTPDGDCLLEVPSPPPMPQVVATQPSSAAPPVEQLQTAPATPPKKEKSATGIGDTIVINVPTAAGDYTPVELVKTEKGYVGPQGELYPDHPTIEELQVLYGD